MNPCERLDSLLSAFLENEASPAEVRFVEDHLIRCTRCREQVAATRSLLDRLHHLPARPVSEGFTDRVLVRIRGTDPAGLEAPPAVLRLPSRPSVPAWTVPLAAAAALAIALLGLPQLRPGHAPAPMTQAPSAQAPLNGIASNQPATGGANGTQVPPPEVMTLGPSQEQVPVGMVRDAYVLEAYELREPAGGGGPVVTPVRADENSRVMVAF